MWCDPGRGEADPVTAVKNKKAISRETSLSAIKSASIKLFVDHGYSNFKVEDLAAACGFTKGAVYHYYRSKEDILFEIIEDIERSILDEIGIDPSEEDATARLIGFLNRHAQYAVQNPLEFCLLVVIAMEFSNSETRLGDKIRKVFDRLTGTIAGLVESGAANGEFSPPLPSADFARVIVGCYNGNVVEWKRSRFDPMIGRALVRGVRLMILKSLQVKI